MTQQKDYVIVGAGISGLTIANELLDSGIAPDDIVILEANNYLGGLIKTESTEGYVTEWGPEGLRGKSEQTQRIFELIGVEGIPVSEESKIRYIGKGDDLVKVPSGALSAITTGLIPFTGKLRILKEPFISKNPDDETVAQFVERRLGKHIVPLVDAFVTGVFGGDPNQLSIKHAFPKLKELEVEYGSLIKGGIKSARKKGNSAEKTTEAEQPEKSDESEKPPFLLTHEDGMQGIIEALAEEVDVRLATPVDKISRRENGYSIDTSGERYECSNLILATGVNALHHIKFEGFADYTPPPKVSEASVMVVSMGFDPAVFETKVEGYGFLIPDSEDRFIMGSLFSSRLFDFRAPENRVMLRVFVGGIRHHDRLEMEKEEIKHQILSDLDDYLGLQGEPEFVHYQLHDRGIPQLNMDHDQVVYWKKSVEQRFSNLYLAGIGWTAISCDKLIEEARELADNIASSKSSENLRISAS